MDNKCLYTCPVIKLFPNQNTNCDERCGSCENCHPGYFKNSTLACQKECPEEEIWIAPNSCTTCRSECYTCLNVTQKCDIFYYPYQLKQRPELENESDLTFEVFILDQNGKPLLAEKYDPELKTFNFLRGSISDVPLVSVTKRDQERLFTYANVSSSIDNGLWKGKFHLATETIGNTPKLAIYNETKFVLLNLAKKEDEIEKKLSLYGNFMGTLADIFELATLAFSFTGVLVPIDRSGYLFRFS